jgi:restriction endonuclease S subunit
LDEDRFFILNRGDLEKRLDPFYYIPSLVALEEQVLANNAVPLRSFVKKMASGATPTVAEFDKYYSNAEEGHPFIRVQNLSETGVLSLEDVKYINDFTQQVYLKRSQVEENDLVTKITGVGRMAVSSVPPVGFKGNINQHSVVIKTESREISEYLAAYLNSDIGEKLATRRSTGGTRPALDYPALRSIPVICNEEIFNKAREAREEREQKENQAQELLASIDDFLLTELGINLPPEPENTIENRKFTTQFSSVTGNRFDPKRYSTRTEQLYAAISDSDYPVQSLKSLLVHTASGQWGDEPHESFNEKLFSECLVIRSTEFDNQFNLKLDNSRAKYRLITKTKLQKLDIKPYDILVEKSGGSPDQPVGRVAILLPEIFEDNTLCYSNFIHKFRVNSSLIDPKYLFAYLKVIHNIKLTDTMQSQTNGIRNLIMREYWNQEIPIPPESKQTEIATRYFDLKNQAQNLFTQAEQEFNQAKQEIEQLILNPIES